MNFPNRVHAVVAGFALAMGALPLYAQTIYRIVGPDGKLTFSDKAPLDTTKATATSASGKPVNSGETGLPYELRLVVSRYPVTLYTSASCAPCNAGRLLLQSRGVPFTEYSISTVEDTEALQRISGDNSLPFLTIGGQKIKGFSDNEWTQFLRAANYPTPTMLPASYRQPPARPLVAVQKPAAAQETQAAAADTNSNVQESGAAAPTVPVAPPAANAANPGGIKF